MPRVTRSFAARHLSAGRRDGRLEILWRPRKGLVQGRSSLRFGGHTKTFQVWEPFVRDPLVRRGSEPWTGWQDAFGFAR